MEVPTIRPRFEFTVVSSVFLPLSGIILSESLLFVQLPRLAIAGHVATLLVCMLGPLRWEIDIPVFQAFTLIPAFRLLNLGMPIVFESPLLIILIIYLPMIPATIFIATVNRSVDLRIGWLRAILLLPLGAVIAILIAWVEHGILYPAPMVAELNPRQLGWVAVIMITQVALVEELLFRGILQGTLIDRLGAIRGLFLAAMVFAMMHSIHLSTTEIGLAFLAGMVYGILYYLSESLLLVILIHGIVNILLYAIFPIRGAVILLG